MERFHFVRDQERFAVCHGNLRHILGSYLQLQPSLLQFSQNRYGKPVISQLPRSAALNFNLSHTKGLALLGVARGMEIGLDVEQIQPIEAEVATQYFSPCELITLGQLEESAWLHGFYNCWTRKEAILKAEGVGLNVRLDAFDVSLAPDALPELIAHRPSAGLKTEWILSALKPSPDAVAALATSRAPVEVSCWQLAGNRLI